MMADSVMAAADEMSAMRVPPSLSVDVRVSSKKNIGQLTAIITTLKHGEAPIDKWLLLATLVL